MNAMYASCAGDAAAVVVAVAAAATATGTGTGPGTGTGTGTGPGTGTGTGTEEDPAPSPSPRATDRSNNSAAGHRRSNGDGVGDACAPIAGALDDDRGGRVVPGVWNTVCGDANVNPSSSSSSSSSSS